MIRSAASRPRVYDRISIMASKQELELMVVDLQRQVSDLTAKLKTGVSDEPVQDDSVIHQLQDELRRSIADKDEAERLHVEACSQVRQLTGDLVEAQKKLNDRPAPPTTGGFELETMQAWELVDKVKYQFLPKDAEVAILRKR